MFILAAVPKKMFVTSGQTTSYNSCCFLVLRALLGQTNKPKTICWVSTSVLRGEIHEKSMINGDFSW